MDKKFVVAIIALIFLAGCAPASYHRRQVRDDVGDRITVGKVQREILIGMSSSQVAEILGSPNVVTTDEKRREVWIYDKIATMGSLAKEINEESMRALYKYSSGSVNEAIEKAKQVVKLEEKIIQRLLDIELEARIIINIRLILESLRRIAEYGTDIAEIALNLAVKSPS